MRRFLPALLLTLAPAGLLRAQVPDSARADSARADTVDATERLLPVLDASRGVIIGAALRDVRAALEANRRDRLERTLLAARERIGAPLDANETAILLALERIETAVGTPSNPAAR